MGCDIHMFVEYCHPNYNHWQCFVANGGTRDYRMFGLLAGVRTDHLIPTVPLRGIPDPEELSWRTREEFYLAIAQDEKEAEWENYTTREKADSWAKYGSRIVTGTNGRQYVQHPDLHSCSTMTLEEYAGTLGRYFLELGDVCDPEYDAILAVMKAFDDRGYKTRLVFGFDN